MLRVLCILCVATVVVGETTNLNDLLDQVLDVLRPKIVKEGMDELPIPYVKYDWSRKVFFVTVYGSITCSNGKARYLSTIKRTGEASGEINSEGIAVQASVGLEIMQFLFDTCNLSVKNFMTLSQSVGGTVGSNALSLKLQYLGKKVRIEKISIDQLSDISITTGTSIIHQMENDVINGMVKKLNSAIVSSVDKELRKFEGKIITLPV